MRYDPDYVYSGIDEYHVRDGRAVELGALLNLADHFHFAVRMALRGRRLVAKGGQKSALWERQANDEIRTQGWTFQPVPLATKNRKLTDEMFIGLATADVEGIAGLVVCPAISPTNRYLPYIREYLPAAMAQVTH